MVEHSHSWVCTALRMNDVQLFTATRMNLANVTLSKKKAEAEDCTWNDSIYMKVKWAKLIHASRLRCGRALFLIEV